MIEIGAADEVMSFVVFMFVISLGSMEGLARRPFRLDLGREYGRPTGIASSLLQIMKKKRERGECGDQLALSCLASRRPAKQCRKAENSTLFYLLIRLQCPLPTSFSFPPVQALNPTGTRRGAEGERGGVGRVGRSVGHHFRPLGAKGDAMPFFALFACSPH